MRLQPAGYAILVAFGDERFRRLIAGRDEAEDSESPYIEATTTFMHTVVVQVISLLAALLLKIIVPNDLLKVWNLLAGDTLTTILCIAYSLVCFSFFTAFIYALILPLASAFTIFNAATWYDDECTASRSTTASHSSS